MKRIAGIPFLILGILLVYYYSVRAWQMFLNVCPNHDFLSWDENIRLATVLDQYVDFRDGSWFRGFFPFLESPTWPPLRSIITFASLYFPTDWPITYRDSFNGLIFLIFVYPTLFYILSKVTRSWFWGSVLSFFSFILTLQTQEVPAYSLTSMLETQSMFFLLWSAYALYRLYEEDNSGEIRTSTKYLVAFSLFGFYFTKYPYGILFFMACFTYEFLRNPTKYKDVIVYLYKDYAKGFRLAYLVFVVLMIFSLPVLRVVSNINLNQRPFKMFMYYISLVLFVDLSLYMFRNRSKAIAVFPRTTVVLWVYAVFPAFLWLFCNPDRVSALIDAQMIVNHYTRSFFLTLWTEPGIDPKVPGIFDFVWGFRILFLVSSVSILYFFANKSKNWKDKIKDPLFGATVAIFLELLILELATGNKQPRHVLQFIPAIGFFTTAWSLRFVQSAESKPFLAAGYLSIAVVLGLVGWNLFYNQGLLSDRFFQTKPFCYRGTNVSDFQPAREIANQLDPTKKYILINAFHDKEKYETKGRVLASDFDLAMKLKTYEKGAVRNDHPRKWKDWSKFDSVLLLSDTCPDAFVEEKFESRSKILIAESTLVKTYREGSGIACLQEFRILKPEVTK
ncbi:hypothetical protein [Leptospira ilyithenensis]|uniref:Dolichyl-phosphate-mannose--protein mannosyltransferase n=1 Tax=Leptospira ilyithenensis TaxID=2484901 RepID=A0A4R9LXM5_9LEPT|nr:hypothetical protein [Leptospira ilyithenensis]TGN14501.1 hypothetical protein EHS11_00440 [Leptospira ilyithenensis]